MTPPTSSSPSSSSLPLWAKLACTVALSEEIGSKTAFSVNVKEMKPIMKAVEGAVDIVRYKNNDHLTFECANHIPMRTFNLPTIVMDEAEERLFDITTQFTIQMPCVALKDFTRRSVDFGSETVRMEVSNYKASDGTIHAFFAMSASLSTELLEAPTTTPSASAKEKAC